MGRSAGARESLRRWSDWMKMSGAGFPSRPAMHASSPKIRWCEGMAAKSSTKRAVLRSKKDRSPELASARWIRGVVLVERV